MKENLCKGDCKYRIKVLIIECCELKRDKEIKYQSDKFINFEGDREFYICKYNHKKL